MVWIGVFSESGSTFVCLKVWKIGEEKDQLRNYVIEEGSTEKEVR